MARGPPPPSVAGPPPRRPNADRLAINGFGRIGRAVLRAAVERDADLEIVAVNDVADPATLAALLARDSVYGRFPQSVRAESDTIVVGEHTILATGGGDPASLPWRELEVDVVIESTGRFRTRAAARRASDAGARKVILSAPAKGSEPADADVVLGVNFDDVYDPARHHIITNASCTTNCLAPVAKVLHETVGIRHGLMTTIHAYTSIRSCSTAPTRTCAARAPRQSTSCPRRPAPPRRSAWSSPSSRVA